MKHKRSLTREREGVGNIVVIKNSHRRVLWDNESYFQDRAQRGGKSISVLFSLSLFPLIRVFFMSSKMRSTECRCQTYFSNLKKIVSHVYGARAILRRNPKKWKKTFNLLSSFSSFAPYLCCRFIKYFVYLNSLYIFFSSLNLIKLYYCFHWFQHSSSSS